MFTKLKTFYEEVKAELSKMNWPTKEQTLSATIVVGIFVLIVTIYLGFVDFGFNAAATKIMG